MQNTQTENHNAPITAGQLDAVRKSLQALNFDRDSCEKSELEQRYLDHYGLDFSARFPGTKHVLGHLATPRFDIACQYWRPAGHTAGTVFVVHGYFDHMGLYDHLIEYLLGKQYAVVAFDLPGHGLSSGERVTIESFDHYVDVFAELLNCCGQHMPQPWHAVGQSTGGAILLKHLLVEEAESQPVEFDSITLLAPLVRPTTWRVNLWVYLAVHRFVRKLKRKFMASSSNEPFNRFVASADPLQARHLPLEWVGAMHRWIQEFSTLPGSEFPVRIVQGDRDRTVDWRYNLKQIRQKLGAVRVHMVPGAGHHLVNEAEPLRHQVFEAMDV